ncbi:hypothetical protein ACO0SA_004319 [Hanseniaspora valbyensis]
MVNEKKETDQPQETSVSKPQQPGSTTTVTGSNTTTTATNTGTTAVAGGAATTTSTATTTNTNNNNSTTPAVPAPSSSGASGTSGSGSAKRSNQQYQQSDLNKVVLEYLAKKGYNQTEQIFRVESTRTLLIQEAEKIIKNTTMGKRDYWGNLVKRSFAVSDYLEVFQKFSEFVRGSVWLYKEELERLLFPVYMYTFMKILKLENRNNSNKAVVVEESIGFLKKYEEMFMEKKAIILQIIKEISENEEEKNNLDDKKEEKDGNKSSTLKQLFEKSSLLNSWRMNKYQVHMTQSAVSLAIFFLLDLMSGAAENNLGLLILAIINESINPIIVSKDELDDMKLEDKLVISSEDDAENAMQITNDKINSSAVKLTSDPLDPQFQKEIEFELKDDEELLKIFINEMKEIQEKHEKELETDPQLKSDSPVITTVLPLPPKSSQDLKNEIEKIINLKSQLSIKKTNESSIKIPTPSICLYTFQNTNNNVTCMKISPDCKFIVTGDTQSQITLYQLDPSTPISSKVYNLNNLSLNNTTTLVGHSGPVYSLDFTPCGKFLVSSSYDNTIKIWSLQLGGLPLVSYKSHSAPVWDVAVNPNGFYFASGSMDMTVRVWSFDHIYSLRLLVGHSSDVSCVEWHSKNGKYLFSGSLDKSVRMWDISDGSCVRIFVNSNIITSGVTSLKCSNDGMLLIIGCEDGSLSVWDIKSCKVLKIMKGHGKSAIYSLSLDYDDEILMSSGGDNSVRVWDLKKGSILDPKNLNKISEDKKKKAEGDDPSSASSVLNNGTAEDSDLLKTTNDAQQSLEQDLNLYGKNYTIKPSEDLLTTFYTKNTPVFDLNSSNGSNLFFATGPYTG